MRRHDFAKWIAIAAFSLFSHNASADRWYPSPTGIRGPIREAGRPWLAGYAFPSTAYSGYSSQPHYTFGGYYNPSYAYYTGANYYPATNYWFESNTWYIDPNTNLYWYYDLSTRTYWYYNQATRTYYYAPAMG